MSNITTADHIIALTKLGLLDDLRRLFTSGLSPDVIDKEFGMSLLHVAILKNDLALCRLLVDSGVAFVPDNFGRYPSTLAAECRLVDWEFLIAAEERYFAKGER